jgi:hypothetical protein
MALQADLARFPRFLVECLTATITYKRGNAPEEVAILNDQALRDQISEEYKTQYTAIK